MFKDTYKGLKILVTGATGFKGSWLSLWLSHLGAEVIGYSKDIPTMPSLFETLSLGENIRHEVGNVLNLEHLQSIYESVKPDCIFHLAAEPIVLESYERPRDTFMTNTLGTINVLDLARSYPCVKAIVVVTSDKCYENKQSGQLLKESDPLGGSDPYSASKACAEIVFHSYFESFFANLPTAVASVRAGNVIGGGDWGLYRIVPDCMRAWSENKVVKIRHPQSIRPWQHVLDVLYGYLLLGDRLLNDPKDFSGESFNFAPEENGKTTLALVESLQKVWVKGQYSIDDAADEQRKEKASLSLDAEKARERLGWHPHCDFQDSVSRSGKWYWQYYYEKDNILQYTLDQLEAYKNK